MLIFGVKLIYSYHDSLGASGREITATEAYGQPRPSPDDTRGRRPWIAMCMVASIDGSTVVSGDSQALSSAADRSVLGALRHAADVIVVGAGTVREEGYKKPKKEGQRIGVVTHSGDLDLTSELFTSGAGLLITPTTAPYFDVENIRAGTPDVDLFDALSRFSGDFIQLEGGATLNGAMVSADLVDEINLTMSPLVTGGDAPRLISGAPDLASRFHLQHVLEDDGFVFLRYLRRR
jgi:riboflavin biosynthesis pyrimidine reductase